MCSIDIKNHAEAFMPASLFLELECIMATTKLYLLEKKPSEKVSFS